MPGECIIHIFCQSCTIPGDSGFRGQWSSGIQIGGLGKSNLCLRDTDLPDGKIIRQSSGIKAKTCDRESSYTAVLIVGERQRIIFSFCQCPVMELKYRGKSNGLSGIIPGTCIGQGCFFGIFQIIVSIEICSQHFVRVGFQCCGNCCVSFAFQADHTALVYSGNRWIGRGPCKRRRVEAGTHIAESVTGCINGQSLLFFCKFYRRRYIKMDVHQAWKHGKNRGDILVGRLCTGFCLMRSKTLDPVKMAVL